jgi:MFS transporter, OFA family, oxalate/formate antiporter
MATIFYGWWIVFSCFAIGLYVSGILFFGFTAFIDPLVKEFGWSYTQVSFAASLRGLEMGVFAPVVGFLVDRFGSRRLILLGVICVGLGLVLLSQTRSLLMFYGAFLLLGFGAGGCTSVVTMTAVGNWFRKRIGLALGILSAGFGASGLLIPLIVYLIEVVHWRTTLILLALGMWTIGIPLSFVVRDRPESYGLLPDGETAKEEEPTEEKSVSRPVLFREALRNRSFLFLNLAEAFRMMLVVGVTTHVMPYLGSVGMSRTAAGLVVAGIPLTSIVGRIGFGWLADRYEKRRILFLSFLMMGGGMLAFCFPGQPSMIFLFLLLFPPSFGGSMVLRGAILREYFGRELFGRMLGIIMGSAAVGGIIGPTLAGFVFDTSGNYGYVWFAFAGVIFLASFLVLKVKPDRP